MTPLGLAGATIRTVELNILLSGSSFVRGYLEAGIAEKTVCRAGELYFELGRRPLLEGFLRLLRHRRPEVHQGL